MAGCSTGPDTTWVHERDRQGLERLSRYGSRGPVAMAFFTGASPVCGLRLAPPGRMETATLSPEHQLRLDARLREELLRRGRVAVLLGAVLFGALVV